MRDLVRVDDPKREVQVRLGKRVLERVVEIGFARGDNDEIDVPGGAGAELEAQLDRHAALE